MTPTLPPDWPNRQHSRFVRASGLNWHVQSMGAGPPLLLLHGTGAATHSWRALMPALAQHFTVIAPDLPGHGFTEMPASARLSLPGMARSMLDLLRVLNLSPVLAAGHSAGAAILARMALDGRIAPRGLVSLNGAFLPFGGPAGQVFSPLARVLVGLPGLPKVFTWQAARPRSVNRLLDATGSRIEPAGAAQYARLVSNSRHVAAALGMMAHWDLQPLLHDLPRLQPPLLLIAGGSDRSIPPEQAERVRGLVPGARLAVMPGLGHLSHEEQPEETAALVVQHARDVKALP